MERIIAVLDRESEYAKRLCDYMNRRAGLPLIAAAFSDFPSYRRFAETHKVLVLLAERELAAGIFDLKARYVISLERQEGGEAEEGLLSCDGRICKYQGADAIIRQMLRLLSEQGELFPPAGTERKTRVLTVYSPLSRCYKTCFAMLLSMQLAKSERVLYLNFESCAGIAGLIGTDAKEGLSEAVYHYKQGSLGLIQLKALIHRFFGVEFIPPMRPGEDLCGIEGEDYAGLISQIAALCDYDTIVVDAGSYSQALLEVLSCSSCIYMPVLGDFISEEKLRAFEQAMEQSGREEVFSRIRKVTLPSPGVIPQRNGYLESLMMSPLGDYVRELAG